MATVASVPDFVPVEKIEGAIARGLNLAPNTILSLVDTGTVGDGEGNNVQLTLDAQDVEIPDGTVGELEEAPIIDFGSDSVNITDGTVRFGFIVSNRLQQSGKIKAMERATFLGTRYLMRRIDLDGFSLFSSFANVSNFTGNDLTEARWLQAMFAYETQEPDTAGGGTAFIAGSTQYLDWSSDINANGGNWTAAEKASAEIEQLMRPGSGYVGMRHGVALFKTNNCPTTGTDRLAAFLAIGMTSPIAYRNWEPVQVSIEWDNSRDAYIVWFKCRYGFALVRDAEARVVRVSNA